MARDENHEMDESTPSDEGMNADRDMPIHEDSVINPIVEKSLADIAKEYRERAKTYAKMAKEYSGFNRVGVNKILVVEDNPANADVIVRMLENEGFECELVDNALDAMEFCKEQTPLIILVDIELPDVDGLSLTKAFRNRPELAHTPIIAVTAHVSPEMMNRAMEAGCDNFIGKPFTKAYFTKIVSRHVEDAC